MKFQVKAKFGLCLCAYLAAAQPVAAADEQPLTIRIPAARDYTAEQFDYFSQALHLALSKVTTQPVKIEGMAPMQVRRQMFSLDTGYIDVAWAVTDPEREQHYNAVYFPIAAGLYGYRIALVNRDFPLPAGLDTEHLKAIKIVQGKDWPDTRILRANGYNVVEEEHVSAFQLLSRHFVDAFPRSVTEVFEEARQNPQLAIEQHYVLYYDNPVFFFTAKDNPELAQQIQSGLNLAAEDGSLLALLHESAFYQKALKALAGRKVVILQSSLSDQAAAIQENRFLLAVQGEIHRHSKATDSVSKSSTN